MTISAPMASYVCALTLIISACPQVAALRTGDPNPVLFGDQIEVLKALRPCVQCKDKQRFGEKKDGGYSMCNELLQAGTVNITAAYSFGVHGYDGWGMAMSNMLRVPVYEYDCFFTTQPICKSTADYCDLRFSPTCVTGANGRNAGQDNWSTLRKMLESNGHWKASQDGSPKLLMKMDIEAHEWDILADVENRDVLNNFAHLVFELHDVVPQGRLAERVVGRNVTAVQAAAMRNLLHNFAVVNLHGNWNCGRVDLGGYGGPACAEITFTNRQLLNDASYGENCETHVGGYTLPA